jgi:CubicO group peptidase (beta-lactamase class C family)
MGILLAATIAERISKQSFPQFLQERVFAPLDMKDSVLGLGKNLKIANTAQAQTEHADPPGPTSWDWNSEYWRGLGAPWGGVHSTAADITKFIRYFLAPTGKPLSPAAATQMITNQNKGLNKPWGLGWALEPPFGHSGSTGTLCWADAATGTSFVLLTTLPAKISQKTIIDPVSKIARDASR